MQRFQGCTSFCEASVKTAPPPPLKKNNVINQKKSGQVLRKPDRF